MPAPGVLYIYTLIHVKFIQADCQHYLIAPSDVIRVVSCKRFGESGRLIELVMYKPSIPILAISLILRKRQLYAIT